MAASDSAAIIRFRNSLASALAASDKSAFHTAIKTLAAATQTPLADVLSLPQLQTDQQLSDLLHLAADFCWVEPSPTWASIIKRTRPNSHSTDPSNSSSANSNYNTPSNSNTFIQTPLSTSANSFIHTSIPSPSHISHDIGNPPRQNTPLSAPTITSSTAANLSATTVASVASATTSNMTSTSTNNLSSLRSSSASRIHWFHPSATTQQAFIPPLPSHPVSLPIVVAPTTGGLRPSFRSWKWFGSGAGGAGAFGPARDDDAEIGEDEDILSTMRLTTDTQAAGFTVAAAFRAVVPFLEDGQRRTLRNGIAYAEPLQALDLIVNAVHAACGRMGSGGASGGIPTRVNNGSAGTDMDSSAHESWNGTNSSIVTGMAPAVNGAPTGDALGTSKLGGTVNGFGIGVWAADRREVAWKPLQRPSASATISDSASLGMNAASFTSHNK